MNKPRTRGRPGPALTFGLPLLLVGLAGYFGVRALKHGWVGTGDASTASVGSSKPEPPGAPTLRLAGDARSDFAIFRGEPGMVAALSNEGVRLEYVSIEPFGSPKERLHALRAGKFDALVLSLDGLLQASASLEKGDARAAGVIVLAVGESAGGDALFLAKGRVDLDDVQATDTACYADATQSEHLWDFASSTFQGLSDARPLRPTVTGRDCWTSLNEGHAQIALLGQPYTALAERAGFPKVFSTGGQADDVIVNVLVVSQAFRDQHAETLRRFVFAYFNAVSGYHQDRAALASFVTQDCGPDCSGDASLGESIVESLDFLDLEENLCLWFGQCSTPSKLLDRIDKTSMLLAAKNRLAVSGLPEAASLIDPSFLVAARERRLHLSTEATEVAGPSASIAQPPLDAREATYRYAVPRSAALAAAPAKLGALTLPGIGFGHASYQLDVTAQTTIADIAEKLRSFPSMCIRIIGYSTRKEDPDPAHRLSRLRGLAVAQELTRLDPTTFPTSRFDVRGLGAGRTAEGKSVSNGTKARKTEFGLFTCATK